MRKRKTKKRAVAMMMVAGGLVTAIPATTGLAATQKKRLGEDKVVKPRCNVKRSGGAKIGTFCDLKATVVKPPEPNRGVAPCFLPRKTVKPPEPTRGVSPCFLPRKTVKPPEPNREVAPRVLPRQGGAKTKVVKPPCDVKRPSRTKAIFAPNLKTKAVGPSCGMRIRGKAIMPGSAKRGN